MSKVTIQDWQAGKRRLINTISGRLIQNMDRAGAFAAGIAREYAPVDRGILQSDVTYVVRARGNIIEAVVGVRRRAFWAWFVELGTAKMAARPFLRPAVFGFKGEILKRVCGK